MANTLHINLRIFLCFPLFLKIKKILTINKFFLWKDFYEQNFCPNRFDILKNSPVIKLLTYFV